MLDAYCIASHIPVGRNSKEDPEHLTQTDATPNGTQIRTKQRKLIKNPLIGGIHRAERYSRW
jgi:hypothetical protein